MKIGLRSAIIISALMVLLIPSPTSSQPSQQTHNTQFSPTEQQTTRFPPPSLRFERLNREDGLSSNAVTAVLQDHRGFLWIGTQEGLNRYDGHSFTVYRHDPDDPQSLRDHFIEALYEDRDGALWAGTQDGWLERYEPLSEGFVHYQVSSHVYAICEGQDGLLWIGTRQPGLITFDRTTGVATTVWSVLEVRSVLRDHNGAIWAASPEAGIHVYDTSAATPVAIATDFPTHVLLEDRMGRIWAGTWGGGLGLFDRESGSFTYFQHHSDDALTLNSDKVSAIYEDASGNLWVGTIETGLDSYDESERRFTHIAHQPSNEHSLSSNSVRAIFEDRSGVLWIGHGFGGGLSKLPSGVERFGHYRHISDNPYSILSGALVTSVFEDQKGLLWIGTFAGLDRWDRFAGDWHNYRHDPDDPHSLISDSVRSVFVDSTNSLWIGTEAGLDRYDSEQDGFVHYPDTPVVMWMDESESGALWLATKSGFYRLDRDSGSIDLLQRGYAWKIFVLEDRFGTVWVGTSGDGLDRYDPNSGEWRNFEHHPEDPLSMSNNSVEAIHEDSTGVLWFGTRGGLNRFDEESESFSSYRIREGLPNDAIVGILEDGEGLLWLATGNGISRFNPYEETFTHYGVRDGVQSGTFWRNAFHKSDSGELFFGGEDGLNVFLPSDINPNPVIPPVAVTQFGVFNEVARTNLLPNEHLTLTYKQDFLSFDYVALDYNDPTQNQYAYRMIGIDSNWVHAGTRRHADFTNMRPGDYVFQVKASNSDGVWNEEPASVRITIQPPFWGTWWFRAIFLLVVAGIAFGTYRLRVRNIEGRSRKLELQVSERTAELEREVEHRLEVEEALRRNEMEKAVAAERSRLARELHDAVTQNLFSASLIAEVLPRLWAKDPERGQQQLEEVRLLNRGALAEMRSLLLELRPEALAKAKIDDLLHQLGRAMTGRTGVPVQMETIVRCPMSSEVRIALYRIAQEALNNVAKHAEASSVDVRFLCEAGRAELSIEDDGQGFNMDSIPAGHLGVGIMRERAASIGAALEIESEIGGGTTVRVILEQGVIDG